MLTGKSLKKKDMTVDEKILFHELMKKSLRLSALVNSPFDETHYEQTEKIVEQTKSFHSYVGERNCVYCYCLIGRNLAQLKKVWKKGKHFIDGVYTILPIEHYSKSQIYFLIDLYNLAQEYNKVAYLTMPLRELKSNFKVVKELVHQNADFWR